MSEQDNIRIVQEAQEAWNKHDPNGLSRYSTRSTSSRAIRFPRRWPGARLADSSCRSMSAPFLIFASTTSRSSEAVISSSPAGPQPAPIAVS